MRLPALYGTTTNEELTNKRPEQVIKLLSFMYDVIYDDGEEVLSNVSLEEAQSYLDKHRFDCFSRTLIIQKRYD